MMDGTFSFFGDFAKMTYDHSSAMDGHLDSGTSAGESLTVH